MKEEIVNERQCETEDEKIDIQQLLFKYIIHWPWFVGAVLVCLIGAWIYLRMATPVYNISATVLIKDDKKGGNTGSMVGLEELGLSGLISSSQNIDNELEVLRSKTLVKEVINLLNLYVSYTDEDGFPSKNMYKTSPVLVSLTPQEAEKLTDPMVVEMALYGEGVLGVGIPVGIIYLIGLTKFKLEGRADVEKLTTIPIVGDIPLTDEKNEKDGSIAVFENQNNLMSETFRNIRTNLQFMLQNDKKVILVTSTVSGEGKSFISANLAISLSLLGKKVVIVGLDIRKPGLNRVFRLSTKEKGITLYLANPETDLMSLVQPSDINQNLYILPGGTVPPNPTELLARDGLDKAIEILKKNFDYVILDTAPVGMVTDTLLIGRVADLSVYVCRADYTHKVEYTLINELAEEKKLPNLCTVINGVDLKRRKYGYYYGYGKYGKYYGYGKRYGYGYGYGQEKGAKS